MPQGDSGNGGRRPDPGFVVGGLAAQPERGIGPARRFHPPGQVRGDRGAAGQHVVQGVQRDAEQRRGGSGVQLVAEAAVEDAFAGMGGNEQGGPRLMVIHEPHVVGVAVLEAEDQALQAADPDRVEPGAIAGKGMQAVARQGDVAERAGLVQVGQGGPHAPAESRRDLAVVVGAGGALHALVGERADGHARSERLSRPSGVGDGDAAGGAFDDGGDGGGPGEALAVGDGDEGAGEVVGEAVGGGSGQGGSPAVVEAAGPPAGDRGGRRRRGIGRGGICVRGEVLLEGVEQDLAGPG